ncbi:MAG: serine/threonine-protein phosphatase, partial [Oscillospiraceae bacterium]
MCDGMGGENAGDVASELAIEIIFDRILAGYRQNSENNTIRNLLVSAVSAANAVIYDMAKKDDKKVGMGTTCVAAIITSKMMYVVN